MGLTRIERIRRQEAAEQVRSDMLEDVTEAANLGVNPKSILGQIFAAAEDPHLEQKTLIKAAVLSIYQEHNRSRLSAAEVQARIDEKLPAELRMAAWQVLLAMVNG